MKNCPFFLLTMIILFLPFRITKGQENQEPEHTCFRLEQERMISLELVSPNGKKDLLQGVFMTGKEWSEKQVFVRISALNTPFSIWINGFRFGSDPGRGTASEYNITPFLKRHANTLDLQLELPAEHPESLCSASFPAVTLLIRDAMLTRDLVITIHPGIAQNEALARFHLFLKSYLKKKNGGHTIQLKVTSPDGELLLQESRELNTPLAFGQETEMIFDLPIRDPHFWLPGAPQLYEVKLSLMEKKSRRPEVISTQFTFSSSELNDSLLVQNGDSVQLRFASADLATILPLLSVEQINMITQKLGVNAIHRATPLPCQQKRLFDQTGILVVFETE